MTALTISLGQMDVSLGEPLTNLERVRRLADEAASRDSDLLLLPELWSTGYDLEHAGRYATLVSEGMFAEMAALAREHNLAILGSCLSLLRTEGYANTAVLFDGHGRATGAYSKVHLFRLMDEEQYLAAGDSLTMLDASWGLSGLAICYDLRFPELFRSYALGGAQIIFLPAEWPHPRLAHWRTLLRARAIENQLFIAACNRVGTSKGASFFGHSCIIDPWGETVIEGDEEEALLTATIDLDLVAEVRHRIPVFADRRPSLYDAFDGRKQSGSGSNQ